MPKPLSHDLRRRVIRAVEEGYSRRAAARRYQVSESTAVKWLQDWYTERREKARAMGAPKGSKLDNEADFLLATIREQPDLTLAEMRDKLAQRGVSCSLSALWNFFKRHDISLKKNGARYRAGTAGRGRGASSLARHSGSD